MNNIDRWQNLPNNILTDQPPAMGILQPDGKIKCQSCTRIISDNRNENDRKQGRKPSCPHCWVALTIVSF